MPRLYPPQPSFNAGEFSDRLVARTDFSKYRHAVETCENLIPLGEGGIMRRPGSRYVAEVADSTVKGRLKGFEYSTTQAYIIEMGNLTFRFYKDQAQIVAVDITASITNGQFTSNITNWSDTSGGSGSIAHDSGNGRLSLVPGGATASDIGIAEQQVTNASAVEHVLKFRVIGAPSDRVELRIGTASGGAQLVNDFVAEVGYHCYSFTATAADFYVQFRNRGDYRNKTVQIDDVSLIDNTAISLDTPYTEAQLPTVDGPQSADVLYLFNVNHPTYKLERRGHSRWSLVEVAWQDGPWIAENETSTTLTFGAATGLGVTVTASSIEGINDDAGFKTTDIGRLIRLTDDSTLNWGWAIIVGHTSTTQVTVDVRRTVTVTTAETKWRLGAWSGTTGYGKGGGFFEQRLFAFGSTKQPQTFFASQTGDFENHGPDSDPTSGTFDGTVEDDDALDFTLSADNVNAIQWMSAGDASLAIGTLGGEWVPSSDGAVITPSDITVLRQTTHGSAAIQPVRVGRVVLFIQRAKRKIWELGFSFEADGLDAFDMTRLAYHVTRGGVDQMAFQEEPHSLVWVVRSDGQLLSMTFRREEDVVGWARHIFGGTFGSGNAVCDSVATIPGTNGAGQVKDSTKRDEVWVIVKRTINGATKRYIEFLEGDFEQGDDDEDAYYSDSIITYDSTSATAMSGLSHLEGESVAIWADGGVQDSKTVSSGAITLDTAASTVQMGLAYTHKLKTLKFEGGSPGGTTVGRKKRIYGVTFVVLNSHLIKYGPDSSNLKTIDFRKVADPMDTPAPLFTGERFQEFEGNWETDARLVIEDATPAPFVLLDLIPEIDLKPSR